MRLTLLLRGNVLEFVWAHFKRLAKRLFFSWNCWNVGKLRIGQQIVFALCYRARTQPCGQIKYLFSVTCHMSIWNHSIICEKNIFFRCDPRTHKTNIASELCWRLDWCAGNIGQTHAFCTNIYQGSIFSLSLSQYISLFLSLSLSLFAELSDANILLYTISYVRALFASLSKLLIELLRGKNKWGKVAKSQIRTFGNSFIVCGRETGSFGGQHAEAPFSHVLSLHLATCRLFLFSPDCPADLSISYSFFLLLPPPPAITSQSIVYHSPVCISSVIQLLPLF